MSVSQASAQPATGQRPAAGQPERVGTQLHGRWLLVARLLWLAITLLALGMFVVSLPAHYDQLTRLQLGSRSPVDVIRAIDPATVRAALEQLGISTQTYALRVIVLEVIYASVFFIVGLIIFWRKSADWMALYVANMLMLFGTASLPAMGALPVVDPAWTQPVRYLNLLGWMLLFVFFFIFPDGRFVPRRIRTLVIAFLAWQLAFTLFPDAFFSPWVWPPLLALAVISVSFGAGVVAQVYRYRRVSNAQQRHQTKWVLYGLMAAVLGTLLVSLPNVLSYHGITLDNLRAFYELARLPAMYTFILALPVTIALAITYTHLYNIDLLINRTLVYVPLTGILAGVYSASIYLLQKAFTAVTGEQSDAAVVITTLILVSSFTPIKNGLQSFVDRRFKEVPDPARNLKAFAAQVNSRIYVVDTERLARRLLVESVGAFHASSGAVYLRQEDGLDCVATYGEWNSSTCALTVPLVTNGKQIGVIELGPRLQGHAYSKRDRDVLQKTANLVADAILPDG